MTILYVFVLSRMLTASYVSIRKSCIEVFFTHVYFSQAYFHLGINDKLGLSGRPDRPIGCLGTSKVVKKIFTCLQYWWKCLFQINVALVSKMF